MLEYTVYMHRCPNGKVYVGITSCSVKKRWSNGYGYKGNKRFYDDIIKYGWDNIQHLILFEHQEMNEALKLEKELIKKYNACDENFGYNMTDGGQVGGLRVGYEKKGKHYIFVRVTAQEKAEIEAMAKDMGLSITNFFRYLVAKERKEKSNAEQG